MTNFAIYVPEYLDAPSLLSCRLEKLRIWCSAIKINQYYYQVNFYHKEIIFRYFNMENDIFYSMPGLIVVDSLEMESLNQSIEYLIENRYFESQKKYRSFEEIKFYPSGEYYKGKRLDTVEVLPL